MNITLRKANALQQSIQQFLKSINFRNHIDISEFQDPELLISKARNNFILDDVRRNQLLVTLYNIRSLVGQANAISEINVKLSRLAYIDKRIGQLEQIANSAVETDMEVIKGRLERLKNSVETSYSYRNSVDTTVITQDMVESANQSIKNLKKEKLELNDEVLALNIKTEITLCDSDVEFLKSEGIL
jgi:hypothetical protein